MKKKEIFTHHLLYFFIISPSQLDGLRDKLNESFSLGILPNLFRFKHPLLLCVRAYGASWFFENVVCSSRYFFLKFITPLKYPILLLKGKMPC